MPDAVDISIILNLLDPHLFWTDVLKHVCSLKNVVSLMKLMEAK